MRVYSRSQGKFIETGTPASTAPTGPVDSSMTAIGVPADTLKQKFFQMGMANPKNITELTGLYNLVKPDTEAAAARKERLAAQDKQQALDEGNKTIDTIYKYWKDGIASGPTSRVTAALSQLTGIRAFNPAHARIQAEFFANLEPALRKSLVSGRITQQEISWLQNNLLPSYTDTEESAREKVQALKTAFKGYIAEPGQTTGAPTSGQYEVVK